MMVDTQAMVRITEANQNFSRVARMADEHGAVLIFKGSAPKYLLLTYEKAEEALREMQEPVKERFFTES